jgi:hypothetical protein
VRFHLSLTIETGRPAPEPSSPESPRETQLEAFVENRVGFTADAPVDTSR